jgi:hypothetical protein
LENLAITSKLLGYVLPVFGDPAAVSNVGMTNSSDPRQLSIGEG